MLRNVLLGGATREECLCATILREYQVQIQLLRPCHPAGVHPVAVLSGRRGQSPIRDGFQKTLQWRHAHLDRPVERPYPEGGPGKENPHSLVAINGRRQGRGQTKVRPGKIRP